jgi:hypothetical protein
VEETSLELLGRFFATAPAARRAVRPLAPGARVALLLDEGPAGFTLVAGAPHLAAGALEDPDFTLRLPRAAVERLAALPGVDVGATGLAFFRLVLERDPSLHVGVSVQGATSRLVARGYLAVLALGGARVALWLVGRGVTSPARLIEKLRGR